MDLITARHIKKNFGGKSTLLKILAGVLDDEGGEIVRTNELRCSYLSQNPECDPSLTVLDQMKAFLKTDTEDYECLSLLGKLKFSYKEQKEFDEIDGVIEELEAQIADVGKQINSAGGDYSRLMELTAEKDRLDEILLEKMERWEYLNDLAEKIARQ